MGNLRGNASEQSGDAKVQSVTEDGHVQMDTFCDRIFESDAEQIDFDTFYARVRENEQESVVQQFCQMIITFRLGIELEASDFIDEEKITVNVTSGDFFRSQSLRRK